MEAVMTLADRCNTIGEVVCRLGGFVRRQANRQLDEPMSDTEWLQHGRVSVFLAFMQLGGNGDAPDTFDWNTDDLTKRALSILQQLTLGSSSDIYDRIMRARPRLTAKHVDEMRWDSWISASIDDLAGHRAVDELAQADVFRHSPVPYGEAEDDRPVIDDRLVQELTQKLRPQEAVWLIRRYRDGIPTSVLARELVEKHQKYQTAYGYTRAVRCIDVAVHRAKMKARQLLGQPWGQLAQEVG